MAIKIDSKAPEEVAADLLVIPFLQADSGEGTEQVPLSNLDESLGGFLTACSDTEVFSGEIGATRTQLGLGGTRAQSVMVVGLGRRDALNEEALRRAGAAAANARGKAVSVAIVLDHLPGARDGLAEALATGFFMASYRFTAMKGKKDKTPAPKLSFICADGGTELRFGARVGEIVADGVNFARDLGNNPGNHMTPRDLAAEARRMARKVGLKATILDEPKMEALGMGSLLSVSRGSKEPARLIVLEHGKQHRGRTGTVCLVGKGLTFDTGGISIKPSGDMDKMRYDMCGGAAVIGAMQVVAEMGLPLHVVGIVPSSENMPGSQATKPGDVVKAMNGKTIEVLNTDAEGRLILADAICYAQRYQPDLIIDMATLTGAVIVALGKHMAAVLGTDDDALAELGRVGRDTHERVWQLPLDDDYDRQIRGKWADLQNIGGREAGTVTAAQFLKHFAEETPWVHVDIAGVAWDDPSRPYARGSGATGFGVRLLARFLEERAQRD